MLLPFLLSIALTGATIGDAPEPPRQTQNLVLVTLDGLRWQEVFGGADPAFVHKDQGVKDLFGIDERFGGETPEARRAALMPFLWGTIAKEGQIFGDPSRGARATLTNELNFSYPGYQELLCGFADPAVDSNAKRPNENVTFLEDLHRRDGFEGRVAVFSGWHVHPFIVNVERSGIFCHAGWDEPRIATAEDRLQQLREDYTRMPRYWGASFCYDVLTYRTAKEYLLAKTPRVFYLALGETDEWAHGRRYDLYLEMARNADAMLRDLWETLQAHEQYRGKTSLVLTVDHGRGRSEKDWTDHGELVEGAEETWAAVLGPDTPALGVRENIETHLSQVAATGALLLGVDWQSVESRAADPLPGVVR